MLSRLVITFLPRSKSLLISWLLSPSEVILEPKKIKLVTISNFAFVYAMVEEVGVFGSVQSLSRVRLLATHGLQPTRLLHPWDFPGKGTGMGC